MSDQEKDKKKSKPTSKLFNNFEPIEIGSAEVDSEQQQKIKNAVEEFASSIQKDKH